MSFSKSAGRRTGMLAVVHLITGLTLPYILLHRITGSTTSLLANAADMAGQIRAAVALLFVGGAIPIAMTIAVWPTLRQRSPGLCLWLMTLAGVNLALQVVENQHWLSMLSISQDYSRAAGSDAALLQFVATMVRSAWRWAHYSHLLVVVSWLCVLFSTLYRFAMVPRGLAAVGVVTTLMQLAGITLPVLFSYHLPFRMEVWGMPLGIAYLLLSVWVMTKGLRLDSDSSGEVAAVV